MKRDICNKALRRAARGKETLALYNGQLIHPQRLQRTLKVAAPITITESQASTSLMFSLPMDRYNILGGYLPFGNNLYVDVLGVRHSCTDILQPNKLENALWIKATRSD